jgi:magnesium-transporting ATPase (P-type)
MHRSLVTRIKYGFHPKSSMELPALLNQPLVWIVMNLLMIAFISTIVALIIERLMKSRVLGFLTFWLVFLFVSYQVFIEGQAWLSSASAVVLFFSFIVAILLKILTVIFPKLPIHLK